MNLTLSSLAGYFDHSLLHPTLTDQDINKGLLFAKQAGVASVCVKPYSVPEAVKTLNGTNVQVGTVVSFPHGNSDADVKLFEAEKAIKDGAQEIDAVLNIGKIKSGQWNEVENEFRVLTRFCHEKKTLIKIIFENDFLEEAEIEKLCLIANQVKPDFIKTSTGFGFTKNAQGTYEYKGATDQHLSLMRKWADPAIQVKAAGGIRTLDDVLRIIPLGVSRIGATATPQILEEAKKRGFQP